MFLTPAHFNTFLNKVGQDCLWRKASACPCVSPNSGAAKPNCPLCKGHGYSWVAALSGTAGISGQKVQQRWRDAGKWEMGDVVVSIGSDSALYGIGYADRVQFLNDTQRFSVVLIRGEGDTLPWPIVSIDRVYWLNTAGTAEVNGGIPTVSAGVLTWAANEPSPGRSYNISGVRHTEYFCFADYPQDRGHFHGLSLPKRVVLRRFDLWGRV